MLPIAMTAAADLKPLRHFRGLLARPSALVRHPAMQVMLRSWGTRYFSFLHKRFAVSAAGGGSWAPLAPSTKAARRRKQKYGKIYILRVTQTLIRALRLGAPGSRFEPYVRGSSVGVRVGYGGADIHPAAGVPIAKLARWHNWGTANMPARKIVVPPDTATKSAMREDAATALWRVIQSEMK